MNDTLPLLKLSAVMSGPPESDYPQPELLIDGNPRRDTWNRVDADLGGGRLCCGIWRCELGHWRIEMGAGEHELFAVLTGCCRVHRDDGSFLEAGPGESLFIPSGFRGSFEVLDTVTKTYDIVVPNVG